MGNVLCDVAKVVIPDRGNKWGYGCDGESVQMVKRLIGDLKEWGGGPKAADWRDEKNGTKLPSGGGKDG
ncbi:hypothetical protein AX774_g3398 [Zancudomyces culisetae]|uniref:Uncharacterized protein n=1 Tax=Zancudomyces culisetae TaxID=1213189 RepID=A0A1R1PQ62_ZANCU|nr:hypothetical protein AX774_g3398 [Zancudomyces culisetae]|eukprot:OMH83100.1 hypothetical protein AX774_g3398 [Zancudomyces culisetae]